MKKITVPRGYGIEAFDGPTENITPQLLNSIYEPIYENKLAIIESALDIERNIEFIISHYFFGKETLNKAKCDEFKKMILASDWCTVSSKRKLMSYIITQTKALEGKDIELYNKELKKLFSYRNAFTHGDITTDGRKVKLSYFEGTPMIAFLNDEYFIKAEINITATRELTMKIGIKIGAFIIGQANKE
jgi:hypothetical protein